MIKFNTNHNNKTGSALCGKDAGQRKFYVPGILMFSLIAFAPVADAGCANNWDPSSILNSELGTSQPVQPEESPSARSI